MKAIWDKYKWWLLALVPVLGFWLGRKQVRNDVSAAELAGRGEQRRVRRQAAAADAKVVAETAAAAAAIRAETAAVVTSDDAAVVAALNAKRRGRK